MNLYDKIENLELLQDELDSEETSQERIQELLDLKEISGSQLQESILQYAQYYKEQESAIEAIKQEIERLKKRKGRKECLLSQIEDALNFAMAHAGLHKVESALHSVSRAKKPLKPQIDDEDNISDDFQKFSAKFEVGAINEMDKMEMEALYGDKIKFEKKLSISAYEKWLKENTIWEDNGDVIAKETGELLQGVRIPERSFRISIK